MQVIFRTFFPFLSRRIDQHRAFAKLSIAVSGVLTVLLIIASPLLIDLFFTDEFSDCVIILQILAVSVFFLSLSIIYGTNYLIIKGEEKLLRNITIVSSIIGFVVAFPLITLLGAVGAALTVCISRGLIGIITMYKAKRL